MSEITIAAYSSKLAWLAMASGCASAIVLASISWPLAFAALPLFAGVANLPARAGRWLLYVWVPLISLALVPIGVIAWLETIEGSRPPFRLLGITIFLAWTAAPILLMWCNAELIRDALRQRRLKRT